MFRLSLCFFKRGQGRLSTIEWNLLRSDLFYRRNIKIVGSSRPVGGEKFSDPCNDNKKVKALFSCAPQYGKIYYLITWIPFKPNLAGRIKKIGCRTLWIWCCIRTKKNSKSSSASWFHRRNYDQRAKCITHVNDVHGWIIRYKGKQFHTTSWKIPQP